MDKSRFTNVCGSWAAHLRHPPPLPSSARAPHPVMAASHLFWRLRAQRGYSTLQFDGGLVSAADVVRMLAQRLTLDADALVLRVDGQPQRHVPHADLASTLIPRGACVTIWRISSTAALPPILCPALQDRQQRLLQGQGGGNAGDAGDAGALHRDGDDIDAEFGPDPLEACAARLRSIDAAYQARAVCHATLPNVTCGGQARPYSKYVCPECGAVGVHWHSQCEWVVSMSERV